MEPLHAEYEKGNYRLFVRPVRPHALFVQDLETGAEKYYGEFERMPVTADDLKEEMESSGFFTFTDKLFGKKKAPNPYEGDIEDNAEVGTFQNFSPTAARQIMSSTGTRVREIVPGVIDTSLEVGIVKLYRKNLAEAGFVLGMPFSTKRDGKCYTVMKAKKGSRSVRILIERED